MYDKYYGITTVYNIMPVTKIEKGKVEINYKLQLKVSRKWHINLYQG